MVGNRSESEFALLQMNFSWVFPVAINFLLAISALWVLVCFVHYGIKTGKFRCFQNRNSAEVLNSGAIYISVVVCNVTALFYYVIAQIYMNFNFKNREGLCEVLADAGFVAYGLVLISVSLFLWTRQRAFYSNGMLNASYSKPVKFLSAMSIVFILACGFIALLTNILPKNREWNEKSGCVYISNEKYRPVQVISIVFTIILGQGTLLGLFVHALTKIRKNKRSTSNNEKSRSSQMIERTMTKTVFFAVVSTTFDVLIQFLVHYISKKNGHRRYVITVTGVSAFFHLLSLILSFNQFKEILIFPCKHY